VRSDRAKGGLGMKAKHPSPEGGAPLSFEEALARLEKIVQALEGQELPLEQTLALYEEGTLLAKECGRRLDEAEQRIRSLAPQETAGSGEREEQDEEEDSGDSGLPF